MPILIKKILPRVPGLLASIMMVLLSAFWTYWGANEMYHEGWWGAWSNRLSYLVPVIAVLIPALIAFRWPVVGGILIILIGGFAVFFFSSDVWIIGLAVALVGILFLVEGIVKRRSTLEKPVSLKTWLFRYWHYVLVIGAPLVIFIIVSASMLPVVLSRVDDGDRSARLIEGNGVDLIWAPQGPGWNWKQPWGGYPSWDSIALYGVEPVGLDEKPGYGKQGEGDKKVVYATEEDMRKTNLCLYLSADGLFLQDEPQNIWRMPTTDEIVLSLGRHGKNAGCVWKGELRQQLDCNILPDKESPLWATDLSVIYYLTADSYNEKTGYFVSYNGMINVTNKLGGNPRHGYRCVKEP